MIDDDPFLANEPPEPEQPPEIDWEAIKQASIAGVTDRELSVTYGVTPIAIRVARHRGAWPTPARLTARAAAIRIQGREQARQSQRNRVTPSIPRTIEGVTSVTSSVTESEKALISGENATEIAAGELLRLGQRASLTAARIAVTSLDMADPDLPLESIADIKTAMSIARTAAGMDKATTAVQVNVWGGQGQAKSNEEWCDE